MIKTGHYLGKEEKLLKKFNRTLARYLKEITPKYGHEFSELVRVSAREKFLELIPRIPYYNAKSYQEIILTNAILIALTRAMREHGKSVEDSLRIQVKIMREKYARIPRFVGRIFASNIGGYFLNRLAIKVTQEGWNTEYIKGTTEDDYDVSIITRQCGVVEYLRSEQEFDYLKYCNFSDFLMFPQMNIGLKQTSQIESGECRYCMKHDDHTEIPESLKSIY